MEQYIASNAEKYKNIKEKAKITKIVSNYGSNLVDVAIIDTEYFNNLSQQQLEEAIALIADEGNLCFGYAYIGKIAENTHRVKIYID